MPIFRKDKSQHINNVFAKLAKHGEKKQAGVRGAHDGIHSIGTEVRLKQSAATFVKWREAHGNFDGLHKIKMSEALQFLQERAQSVGQKTLDADRHALQKLLKKEIAPIKAKEPHNKLATANRSYSVAQVKAIVKHMDERNALATKIAYATGVRAHELHTIRRESNGTYSVTGKGGLSRNIRMPKSLEHELESRRLETPKQIKDRGIVYHSHYDIGGGKSLSHSFSRASKAALGLSHGFHGLRHTYAQHRMHELQNNGYSYDDAKRTVSQELGHFRPSITERYLRGK